MKNTGVRSSGAPEEATESPATRPKLFSIELAELAPRNVTPAAGINVPRGVLVNGGVTEDRKALVVTFPWLSSAVPVPTMVPLLLIPVPDSRQSSRMAGYRAAPARDRPSMTRAVPMGVRCPRGTRAPSREWRCRTLRRSCRCRRCRSPGVPEELRRLTWDDARDGDQGSEVLWCPAGLPQDRPLRDRAAKRVDRLRAADDVPVAIDRERDGGGWSGRRERGQGDCCPGGAVRGAGPPHERVGFVGFADDGTPLVDVPGCAHAGDRRGSEGRHQKRTENGHVPISQRVRYAGAGCVAARVLSGRAV